MYKNVLDCRYSSKHSNQSLFEPTWTFDCKNKHSNQVKTKKIALKENLSNRKCLGGDNTFDWNDFSEMNEVENDSNF